MAIEQRLAPDLPKIPASDGIDIDAEGNIVGLAKRSLLNAVRFRYRPFILGFASATGRRNGSRH